MAETVSDIVKQIVLAHADGELRALAVVMVNAEGEPEINYVVDHGSAYAINFGCDIIKAGLMSNVINHAGGPGKDRE